MSRKVQTKKTYWRINSAIQAKTLRVINLDGKQLGVFGLPEALKKAQEEGLDLVEIAPRANPPVAKIIDFTKFKYQQEKREREARKGQKRGSEQKEIWLTPYIADSDYQTRLARIREFLSDGEKVRVVVKFTGPQMAHREFGFKSTDRVRADIQDLGSIDQEPKFLGRQLAMVLTPSTKGKGKQNENEKDKT